MSTTPHDAERLDFGVIIIGDELLSGRRQDRHMAAVIERLNARGLELAWARFIGDDASRVTRTLQETLATRDVVFSFGGIGATPDDRTRQCCAAATSRALVRHPEAEAELRAQFGDEATAQRLRMVEFPEGAEMIPNPVNRVAGFSISDHHFVPGFPSMAWPMVEWVLDHHYPHLQNPGQCRHAALRVPGAREGALIPLLEAMEAEWPDLRVSCLPSGSRESGFEVELGVCGAPDRVEKGLSRLQIKLAEHGYHWSVVD